MMWYEAAQFYVSRLFVQAFKIFVDSWKFSMLLIYILWDDWPIIMISGSNEQLQQQLEYTLLKPDCHSWWISKRQSGREDTLEEWYEVLRGFRKRFRRKRPALFKSGQWYFHQDNAPVHNSILVTDYLTKMAPKQFIALPIIQTLPPVTFAYSPSSEAVVMRQLRRWKRLWRRSLTCSHKRSSMGPFRSCWNGRTSALQPEEITSKGTRVSCVYYE